MWKLRVLACVLAVSYSYFLLLVVAHVTDPSEVKALKGVKSRLIDPMNNLRNWNKGDPCVSNWTKVICSNQTGTDGYLHVTELQLMGMNLSGILAPELGQLTHLWILDFMWNEITGTIPKEIGNIQNLTLLLLNGNKLRGSFPDELGNLSKLNRLQVDQNQMSGPLPKSFANLIGVRHLHLNNNSFSGQIPSELSKLPCLLHLLLDSNNFSGRLPPELSNITDLRILQLDNNNFSESEIPATYGNLSKLVKISLRNCGLQGAVPDLSRIVNLSYIDLSRNHLVGTIPSQKLSHNVTTIDLSYNRLNGSIPGSFWDLPSLQKLDLRNNSLSAILEDIDPQKNVTLRLGNNPICKNATIQNIGQFCRSDAEQNEIPEKSKDPKETRCPIQTCPLDNSYEFVPSSLDCYCAAPIRIEYRLKSPSFSYFRPYSSEFKVYLTSSLKLKFSQLSIDSFSWEEGPRLRMYLKLFPLYNDSHSYTFNESELQRIREQFTEWHFPRTDFFGPYELLNFTLLGPYKDVMFTSTHSTVISKGILVAIILGAIACIVTIAALVSFFTVRYAKYHRAPSRRRSSSMASMKIDGVKAFTFKEMASATGNFTFSTQVGRGGYGKVFKGILADNTIVAIKRAEEGSLQGQKEFLTEIELLSRLHHRNLVSLLGYCDEEDEQMLVYEFMPNGTLRDWLSAKAKGTLNFSMRLRVAMGSAKGILYLHTEADPPIFHRDIKASNILLDSNFTAKVADFGLSRLAPTLDSEGTVPEYVSTVVKGTPGYLDPEYFLTHKLTDKSDVYSLGVVFLELLTGMHPISHGKNIVREVLTAHQSGTMFSVIDSNMGSYSSACIEKFAALALSCCHDQTEKRPSMLEVVRELEDILQMMPESDTTVSESTSSSTYAASLATPSSSFVTRNSFASTSISGSDLVSGVIPTISPR
ncbi:probable LRR receptor-like serine/threonine-protein kinase At1g06840 [Humulus lupulus]|uniref:probable LRR receptor-like serine/threonine-protein kinase At1g06840 n=1 Tax=Humulus lupulus TaxID=3486 RepID=UPI002B4069B5|nr:probable LRR receptor-like serine/threonine-protein kinase At1g06840 [Humulus lupulus]XP_062073088.1 probable LRR receptor-like serine/threonine-protein kinase At1g06840 [Humulus lupulus]